MTFHPLVRMTQPLTSWTQCFADFLTVVGAAILLARAFIPFILALFTR